MSSAACSVVALAVTALVAPLTLVALRRRQLLDVPSARSSHDVPVPRGIGIALAVGAFVALAFADDLSGWPRSALIVGVGGLTLLGLVEDLRGVPPAPRFAAQLVFAVVALPFLLDGATGSLAWKVVFAGGIVVWLVAFANAFNFMDGIDGISIAQTAVAGVAFVVLGNSQDIPALTAGGAIAIAVVAAFAPFNFPSALAFLGDSGSYFLGGWLAVLVVVGLRADLPAEAVVAPLVIYLADTGTTLIRRIRQGERWWEPHRSHAYQRLVIAGWSHRRTTVLVTVAGLACAALGGVATTDVIALRVVADIGILAVAMLYLSAPTRVERRLNAA